MNTFARRLVIVLASIHVVLVALVSFNWLTHRTFLTGGESPHAQFAYQFAEGLPIYGPYDLHNQELWYTPLSFQAEGLFSRPFGYDVRAMRFVNFSFAAGAIFLIGLIVYRQTGSRLMGYLASAFMCGVDAEIWFISLSPNAAHVFFAVLAVYLLMRDESLSWRTVVLSTVALFASAWSKQTGVVYIAAGVFYMLTRDVRKAAASAVLAGVLLGGSVMYYVNKPDASFLAMTMSHSNHPMIWSKFLTPAMYPELLGRFGVLCAVLAAGLFAEGWNLRRWLRPEYMFLGASGFIGTLARLKYGSGPTQAIVFYGMIIACGMVVLDRLMKNKQVGGVLAASLLRVQALALVRDLSSQFITADDDFRFQQVLDILATPGRNTYYLNQGFLNVLVGKPAYTSPSRDCWYKGAYDRAHYPQFFRDAFAKDPFELVIIDVPLEDNSWYFYERLNANYKPVREIPPSGDGDQTLRYKKIVFVRSDLVPKSQATIAP